MKHIENNSDRRMGRKSLGTLLTVLVVAGVILLNLVLSMLGLMNLWQVDETVDHFISHNETLYTLTQPFETLIQDSAVPMVDKINLERTAEGEDPLKINIIFCADRDTVWESDVMRYPLYTALQLQKAFPDQVNVSFINILQNPSAVQKYKATPATKIYSSNIIFEFGTEYRVYALSKFFLTNSGESAPWAYNGEKHFANAILAITRAESPVACFLTNHGEQTEDCEQLRLLVERAGYVVQDLDLEKDPIPENCRMLISYDPQNDFYAYGSLGEEGVSEIQKLDEYLDNCFSFMLFVDNETPELPNLEEFLEEWGITVSRVSDTSGDTQNYTVRDTEKKLDKDGYTLIATYAEGGTGASITSDMRQVAYPAKVIFPNATAIQMSDRYHLKYSEADETKGVPSYRYGSYVYNGVNRTFCDVFLASPSATAEINGETYEISTEQKRFKLMTLTSESRIRQEENYDSQIDPSYVCVFGSTEFASDEILASDAYGNADVLVASLRVMGREIAPVRLDLRGIKDYQMDEDIGANTSPVATTVWLTLIPALISFGIGIAVTVNRKYK